MREARLVIAVFVISSGLIGGGHAYAGGYGSLGGAYTINTYGNQMDFDAPQADIKFHTVEYLSETALYDNLAVCRNKGGNITLVPGLGQSDPVTFTKPLPLTTLALTTANCHKTGSVNDCAQSVLYVSKLVDVVKSNILVCNPVPFPYTDDQYGCYLFLLGLPANFECQNNNGSLIQLITKGVCARQTAKKDGTPQANGLYRYTYPSFTQPETNPPATFSSTESTEATCGACLAWNGQGTNPCLSPTP